MTQLTSHYVCQHCGNDYFERSTDSFLRCCACAKVSSLDECRKPLTPPSATPARDDLPALVLAMCKSRNWSLHWTARGAYLHLESSELIEAVRGKNLDGHPREYRIRDEAADVLLVLMSITESNGIDWQSVLRQAKWRTEELMASADKPYAGEERAPIPLTPKGT